MLKIKVVSDLHLEFSDLEIPNNGCDVLILSGDILIAEELHRNPRTDPVTFPVRTGARFRNFLHRCSSDFKHVFYVAGNHEFYQGKFYQGLDILREECSHYPNVYFLENDSKVIDDTLFVGGTLWTNCNNGDPHTMFDLSNYMNDYRIIRNDKAGYTKLRPEHTRERHNSTFNYIQDVVKAAPADQKVVVITHHSPSKLSTHPRYADDYTINGGYSSDLSNFIMDHTNIKLWTHGHTHHPFDYTIGETRIVCNPRGYEGYEDDTGWNIDNIIEV